MDGNGAQGSGFFDLSSYYAPSSASVAPSVAVDHHQQRRQQQQQPPRLTCLKLGKRPYYEGHGFIGTSSMKKERPMAASAAAATTTSSSSSALAPRCQVDGCGKVLVDVKEYHRRHKVCEIHAKAPNVLVLGSEQRFCQQCSRFHAISEFDETKRSCRRRLAGHNERRRKSTSQDSILKNPTLESTLMGSRYPFISSAIQGRALSLLSSKSSPWVPTSDLSSRSSAALRELIAENRAAVLAKQLFLDRGASENTGMLLSHGSANEQEASQLSSCSWNQFQEGGSQVTLDLMQMPGTSFDIIPGRSKNKAEAEECCEIWKSLESTHVV